MNNFKEDGYEILRGILTGEEADEAAADLDAFYKTGAGTRVVNLHMDSPRILEAITKEPVAEWLEANCFLSPTIYTTLSFQKGTQQEIHRDMPHFLTWPLGNFVGVWYALEDTTLENGCLRYFKGGHLIEEISGKQLANELYPNAKVLTEDQIDNCMQIYHERVRSMCSGKGLPIEQAQLKKGDVLIWHSLLPHGGSEILNPALTRKSIVAHCIPLGTRVYNARQFFNPEFDENKLSEYPLMQYSHNQSWFVQTQPKAFFQGKYI